MLQVLYLNVLKVDRVLHMGCTWEARGARACPARAHDAGDVQVLRDPTWAHKTQAQAGDVQAARALT